jgi:cytochrome c biogenesis protein ResB
MKDKMVKPGADTWRMWLGLGLGGLSGITAVLALSIGRDGMPIFLAVSVLVALAGLIQLSLWSKTRRSWL